MNNNTNNISNSDDLNMNSDSVFIIGIVVKRLDQLNVSSKVANREVAILQ